ncbi:MAG: DEAD/DEAH box helicase [bacterium]|nr:DEAD/DEAH box helicase [bacterium]
MSVIIFNKNKEEKVEAPIISDVAVEKNSMETIAEPKQPLPPVSPEELPERMRRAMAQAGWTELMPVQSRTIPYIMAGRDLMIQSRTGSGKTGAFLLPILERIDHEQPVCQALILVPTRELAKQVAVEAEILGRETGIRSVAVYGGVGYKQQIEAFQAGAHLVVGTPGRILDHLLKGALSLDNLRILVFDEADRMLSMGFYPDMKRLQRYLSHDINGYMFSATLPPYVIRLAEEFLHKAGFLSLSRDRVHVSDSDHIFYLVPAMNKDRCLVKIIEVENPLSGIIFCNTKSNVHYVSVVLRRFGYDVDELTSDLTQNAREKVLGRVRRGELRFLVATDVAARGIDIPNLSHVVIYETPKDPENYIHRAGRTGRAGAAGVVISLVADMEEIDLRHIARRYGITLEERSIPNNEDVEAVVAERVTAMLEARLRSRDQIEMERIKRFIPLGHSLADSEDELTVIAMLLEEFYHQTLNTALPRPSAAEETVQPSKTLSSGSRRRPPRRREGRR